MRALTLPELEARRSELIARALRLDDLGRGQFANHVWRSVARVDRAIDARRAVECRRTREPSEAGCLSLVMRIAVEFVRSDRAGRLPMTIDGPHLAGVDLDAGARAIGRLATLLQSDGHSDLAGGMFHIANKLARGRS